MTVEDIVAQRRRPASETARARRVERLRDLDADRMFTILEFLAGFRPSVFDAVLKAPEPEPDPGFEPFCTECNAHAGIFWLLGNEWHHFRPGIDPDRKPEVYDPGHDPIIGWRNTAGNVVPRPRRLGRAIVLPVIFPAGRTIGIHRFGVPRR